jgi:di/tricarboxylate transporter
VELLILLAIILGAVILFVTELIPIDLTAGLLLASILLTNIVSTEEALSGVSNPATITIGAMFILSYGLTKTGAVRYLGDQLVHVAKGNDKLAFILFLLLGAVISSLINNTAAVAIFLPLGIQLSREFQISPSKLLMPLSYASIFGGTMTLIGTSTNILVSNISYEHGFGRLQMFEFTKLGILFMITGMLYLIFLAKKMLPARIASHNLTQKYDLSNYLTELRVPEDSHLIGSTAVEKEIGSKYDLNILGIIRGKKKILIDIRITPIKAGDILILRGQFEKIVELKEKEKLLLLTEAKLQEDELNQGESTLTEILITPNSNLIGRTLKELDFRRKYGTFVLAIKTHGETVREKLSNIPLHAADSLLVFGSSRQIDTMRNDSSFILLNNVDFHLTRNRSWLTAVLVIVAVVLLAALEIMPIIVSALLGCLVLVLSKTITLQEAYEAVDWSVIILLAGVIPLGIAMEKTGLAAIIGQGVATFGAPLGPLFVLAGIYLATSILTEIMSNNSTAILMAPIAIATAEALAVSPMPFLMCVAYAGSASFMTPVGYQTNTMVYGPGGYRYGDFFRFGGPLQLVFMIIAVLLIPIFWPF